MKRYYFDEERRSFQEYSSPAGQILLTILKYLGLGFVCSVVMYVVFALLFDTNYEQKLSSENSYLEDEYSRMQYRSELLDDVIKGLQVRDKSIYRDIFGIEPPSASIYLDEKPHVPLDSLIVMDNEHLAKLTSGELQSLAQKTEDVSRQISAIFNQLEIEGFNPCSVPSILPVANFRIAQTGASKGKKINPFYKSIRQHNGIDIIAPQGTEVYATADGKVAKVTKSNTGMGNSITIQHENGLETVYAHLSEMQVKAGQKVRQGDTIGLVGTSGTTFAAALHYEVIKYGRYVDPVNYFFAEISPAIYRDMVMMSSGTGQSMD